MSTTPTPPPSPGRSRRGTALLTLTTLVASTGASVALATPAAASVTTSYTNPTPITVNDDAPASPNPTVVTVPSGLGTVESVSITFLAFQHEIAYDTQVILTAPSGASLTITCEDLPDQIGTSDYTISDADDNTCHDLSHFIGEDPTGKWSVDISDTIPSASGSMEGLRLTFVTSGVSTGPVITEQPSGGEVEEGTATPGQHEVTFTSTATTDANTGLAAQWEVSKDNGATWGAIAGAASSGVEALTTTYTVTRPRSDYDDSYRVVFTDVNTLSTASNPVSVDVHYADIATDPQPQTVTAGESASFTVTTDPQERAVHWELSTDAGDTWSQIAGSGGKTYTIDTTVISQDGHLYRAVAYDAGYTKTSASALLTVTSAVVPQAPSAPQHVTAVQSGPGAVTITWEAPASQGSSPVTSYGVGYGTGESGDGEDVSSTTRTRTFTGLSDGAYTAGVSATNSAGSSSSTTKPFTIVTASAPVDTTPPPPTTQDPTPVQPVQPPDTAGYTATTPARLLDTRDHGGAIADRVVTVDVPGLPAGAESVVLNVTATGAAAPGHVVAYEAGTTAPGTSNLNFARGRTQANLAVVPVGPDGRVHLKVTGTAHLVVDLLGHYGSEEFTTVPAVRALDTRTGYGTDRGVKRGVVTVTLPDSIPATASHVLLNVTSASSEGSGHVSARASAAAPEGMSSLNFAPDRTQANLVPVEIGPNRTVALTIYGAATHLIADTQGYWTNTLVGGSARLLDTRKTGGAASNQVTFTLPTAPVGATTALVNITVTGGSAAGHAVVHPAGTAALRTSNVNWGPKQTQANLVVVPVTADGTIAVDVAGGGTVQVIADLVGFQK